MPEDTASNASTTDPSKDPTNANPPKTGDGGKSAEGASKTKPADTVIPSIDPSASTDEEETKAASQQPKANMVATVDEEL